MKDTSGRLCTTEGCEKILFCRGMCSAHYMAFRRAGGKKVNVGGVCAIEGCTNAYHAKGYCKIHFLRITRHGTSERLYEDHNMRHSDEYATWLNIKQRCFNPNFTGYKDYGGRGITMDEIWKTSFLAFYDYVGPRPTPKYSIERINTNGNYEPGNVRWATATEQGHNQRISVRNTSGYKGIHFRKDIQKWAASISHEGKKYHLGLFDTDKEAAKAYNKAAFRFFGKYAFLNIIED